MRTAIALVLMIGTIGCSKNKTVAQTPTPPAPSGTVATTPPPPTSGATTPSPGTADCGMIRVHFAFDSSVVILDERSLLEQSASCLKGNAGLRVVIEGNADERGTVEYNIALGQRRADAVRQYLEQLGVSAQQLSTVSYGEEKPLCAEKTEDCWQTNRRAQLNPTPRG